MDDTSQANSTVIDMNLHFESAQAVRDYYGSTDSEMSAEETPLKIFLRSLEQQRRGGAFDQHQGQFHLESVKLDYGPR